MNEQAVRLDQVDDATRRLLKTEVRVHLLDGREFPAALVLTRRLVEVELHHTDLGCGYRRADWPAAFAAMDLPEPARSQRADRR